MKATSIALVALIIGSVSIKTTWAKSTQTSSLHDSIVALDLAFFEAFNSCNLEVWKRYLAEDIEFYQDNDNVTTSRKELVPSFMDRCGKDNVPKLQRELIAESVEVHPIQGFGAVQFGTHHFWTMKNKVRSQLVAKPKFVHLWRNKNGVWQITRVISYGH